MLTRLALLVLLIAVARLWRLAKLTALPTLQTDMLSSSSPATLAVATEPSVRPKSAFRPELQVSAERTPVKNRLVAQSPWTRLRKKRPSRSWHDAPMVV